MLRYSRENRRVMLHTALGTAAALVALAFTLSLWERWLDRRRTHELAWAAAMAMFTLAAGALAAGAAVGWTPAIFRVFYVFGAIANVPILALGTVYLLARRERAEPIARVVVIAVAVAAGVVIATPLRAPLPRHHLAQGSEVFDALPRILAAVASGGGAVVVFAGAAWSALRRRRLVAGNLLIALGTAVTGASGILNSVADAMTGFAVTLVIGVALIFAGFLVASTGASDEATSRPSPSAVR
jgi:hypothetical protein